MARKIIIMIDDDKHFAELVQQYLEAQGFEVFIGLDGMHAHPMARTYKPSLVILDVDMPIITGLQALKKLRADPITHAIPVIMLTGVVSGRVYPVIETMPNVSHIKKPVHLEDLISMVRHYIPENS